MTNRRKTLVVRIWQDEVSLLHGVLIDPQNETRTSFASAEELWRLLLDQTTPAQSATPLVASSYKDGFTNSEL